MIIIFWLICGFSTAYIAKERGRDPVIWFFVGLMLGIFGLLLVIFLPKAMEENHKMAERSKNQGKATQVEIENNQSLQWFYITTERQQVGPMTWDALRDKWQNKIINTRTFIWREGWTEWKRIEDLDPTYFLSSKTKSCRLDR